MRELGQYSRGTKNWSEHQERIGAIFERNKKLVECELAVNRNSVQERGTSKCNND